ncbi:MAG TPA: fluoride efflux transporter CrcB [Pyrinomonadaceae bacterium]
MDYLLVAAGGAVGACLRYFIGGSVFARTGTPFPLATFVINVSGSFIIGFFLTLATERLNISPHLRLAVAVGFVGAYTTFSTFEYETIRLIEEGHLIHAVLNVVLSVTVGFVAVWGGIALARKFEHVPVTSHTLYQEFEQLADASDPHQSLGAERDIRDASIQTKEQISGLAAEARRQRGTKRGDRE